MQQSVVKMASQQLKELTGLEERNEEELGDFKAYLKYSND